MLHASCHYAFIMRDIPHAHARREFSRKISAWALLGYLAASLMPLVAARADEPAANKIGSTPWHLVDLWWNTGLEVPLESYSLDVMLPDELPTGVRLYIAPVGLGKLGGTSFYGGLQTQVDGSTKDEPRLRVLGRGMLFSMWGERSLAAIRPAQGGFLQSSGHEGDFVSVRRPFEWSRGTYTYRVIRMDREQIVGKPYTWVAAFLYVPATNENIYVGALRFPGENLVLGRQVASFVEIYGPAIPLATIPRARITFGNLRVNGQSVAQPGVAAIYPKGVPDYAAASLDSQGNVEIRLGEKVESRPRREAVLRAAPAGAGNE